MLIVCSLAEYRSAFWGSWQKRIRALPNILPLLGMVWRSGRPIVGAGLGCRALGALIPITMLWVTKLILDALQAGSHGQPLPSHFWWLVVAEFGLAVSAAVLGRATGYFDALLADQFTRYVTLRVIEHASQLDLAAYEDPVFYDKLERARVQATDRIAMIRAMG